MSDTHLFISIDSQGLEFGFFINHPIGVDGIEEISDERKRFLHNCQKNYARLTKILRQNLADNSLFYGHSISQNEYFSWKDWLAKPENTGIKVRRYLEKDEVLRSSYLELSDLIAQTFIRVFPLVLLAIYDDPIPAILKCVNKPIYDLDKCVEDTGVTESELKQWVGAINRKRQAILQGPPGTGKTYLAERLARHLIGGGDGFKELVQFHPAYSYEDFIQGIRPQTKEDKVTYEMVPGRFLEFCKKAESCKGLCVLIIDEINRANLSQVFGELMYLLEYREEQIFLAGSIERFGIPKNVRIIGTMNTADRSIALIDNAFRRRFAFITLPHNYTKLKNYHPKNTSFSVAKMIEILKKMNKEIDKYHQIGISFFLIKKLTVDELEDIWHMEIEPYLEEYFFDQRDKVEEFSWDNIKDKLDLKIDNSTQIT